MAALPWNQWQLSRGMGGSFRLESVAGLVWNTQKARGSFYKLLRVQVMKPTKPIHREEKGWGYEVWIHNSEDYCGNVLFDLSLSPFE